MAMRSKVSQVRRSYSRWLALWALATGIMVGWTAVTAVASEFPESWDWRDREGRSFVPPVGDQGLCGGCVSFALVGALESMHAINAAEARPPDLAGMPQFSRQYLMSCGGGSCRGGTQLSRAVAFLRETGLPEGVCLDFVSAETGETPPCETACPEAMTLERIADYSMPTQGFVDVGSLKDALLRGPLVTSMLLYEDFMTYRGGTYRHRTGRLLGSHAVLLVGWDDLAGVWILRNSFGSEWGESGDARVAYDDVSLLGRYSYLLEVRERR